MNLIRSVILLGGLLISFSISAKKIERIVSLTPSITKNIYFLDAQDLLVGCTSYCAEGVNDNKDVVATAVKVNIEKVISLNPDIVFTSNLTEPETIEMLRKFDIQVEVFSKVESFNTICEQFLQLGNLIGYKSKAEKIIAESNLKISEICNEFQTLPKQDIFFQIGADPIFTVLPKTFMNDFITLLGARNVAEKQTRGTITRESVIAHDPDFIFVVTMGIMGENEQKTWLSFKDLKASHQKHVFVIDAEKACTPTPITFVETLDTIANLLLDAK